jgi:hypothetical protein
VRCLAASLLIGLLALAGCGGSDSGSSKSTSAATKSTSSTPAPPAGLTHAQYIARADAFCRTRNVHAKALNTRLKAVTKRETTAKGALAAVAPILDQGYRFQAGAVRGFKAIKPPAADRATIARLWRYGDQSVTTLARISAAAHEGNVSRFQSLIQQQRTQVLAQRKLARDFGLTECGSGNSDAG